MRPWGVSLPASKASASPTAGRRCSVGGDTGHTVKPRQRRATIAGGGSSNATFNEGEFAKWSKGKMSEQARLLADATEVTSHRILRSRAFAAALPVPEASDARFAPMGFSPAKSNVSLKDLALSGPPSAASPATSASTPNLVSLQEESIKLREANLSLREEGFTVKQDVEAARAIRDALREEIAALQAQRDLEGEKLTREQQQLLQCQRQRVRMKEKLQRCCEVVATTVGSVDRLQEEESCGGASLEGETKKNLLEQVHIAGRQAVDCLEGLDEDEADDEDVCVDVRFDDGCLEDRENQPWEDENIISTGATSDLKPMKKQPECRDLRAPLRSLNVGD